MNPGQQYPGEPRSLWSSSGARLTPCAGLTVLCHQRAVHVHGPATGAPLNSQAPVQGRRRRRGIQAHRRVPIPRATRTGYPAGAAPGGPGPAYGAEPGKGAYPGGAPLPQPAYPGASAPPFAPAPKPPGFDVEAAQAADTAAGFANAAVRRGFMRKVLLIVLMQLVVTAGISLVFYYVTPLKTYVRVNLWPFYLSWFLSFGMIIALSCSERLRKQYPLNICFLAAFTVVFSFQVGVITSYWDTQAVLTALVATAGVVAVCCALAFLTPLDFTKLRGFLTVFSFIFMFAVFFALVIGFMWVRNTTIVIIAAVAAVLFSLYLIYDLQLIMGGKTLELSPDDYVAASLSIYLDVINIFLALLTIIGITQN